MPNISRIDPQTNLFALIEAFLHLRQRERKVIPVLMGPETQPEYAARLRSLVASLGLTSCVKMLPGLQHGDPDLVDAYAACDVFVIPSLHEPFGVVTPEA